MTPLRPSCNEGSSQVIIMDGEDIGCALADILSGELRWAAAH